MNRFIAKTRSFIFAQQSGIVSTTLLISGMLMLARVFGLVRYRVFNSFFSKEELEIFFAAFRIPDFLFELLITGALTTSFIPFFLKYHNDQKKQNAIISSVINLICIALAVLIGVLFICMPLVVRFTVLGFDEASLEKVVYLSRILLIAQLPFLVLGNIATGLSQAYKRFIIPSFAPVMYNIGIIVVTVLLAPTYHMNGVAIGVIAGAILFFFVQIPQILQLSFQYEPIITHLKEIKGFLKTITPRLFTVLVAQIEVTIDQTLSTLVSTGSYTIFYYAQTLQLVPVSIIGMAFGQASLPYLSEIYQKKQFVELKKIVIDSICNVLFVTAPIMAFFIIARTPIVRLVYGGHKFDWSGTVSTAETMSYFAFSIPLHSCYYFITRCFYATLDTKTPFVVSIGSIIFNVVMSFFAVSVFRLPVWSLGITFSIAITVQVTILLILFHRKVGGLELFSLLKEVIKIIMAAILAVAVMYPSQRLLDGLIFDTTRTINLVFLLITTGGILLITYLFACWTLNAKGLYFIIHAMRNIRRSKSRVVDSFISVDMQ
ncbi:MAG: murein biosynthesis integral membrane protein MurJ [Candidatus Roizmanbacteria bacterium]